MKKLALIQALLLCLVLTACVAPAPAPVATAAPVSTPVPTPAPTPLPTPQYVATEQAVRLLEAGAVVVDVQPKDYYNDGHLLGAIATYAYPANTEALCQKLDAALTAVEGADAVLLVDMGGKAGAHNAWTYYVEQGVDPGTLYILEGGMLGLTDPGMRVVDPAPYELQYMPASDLRASLRNERPVILVDIRHKADYDLGHFENAVNLTACVEDMGADLTSSDLVNGILPIRSVFDPVVLISTDGGADAEAAVAYYARHGVDPTRLFILEGGVDAWPPERAHYLVPTPLSDGALIDPAASDAVVSNGAAYEP